ncbi:hypothetical protein BS47DRAFT_1360085 [Hydnum rufescens UP504]|uniref:DNA 3'-5' helicase n=1 Tax=Hydnum rufescens UP504 TaxID=1448309 RepID=A0A9P6B3A0_9AGAM|nr:hypothetical protein BS47DRAFT_1360085 [Hydnum rufescens UP504]
MPGDTPEWISGLVDSQWKCHMTSTHVPVMQKRGGTPAPDQLEGWGRGQRGPPEGMGAPGLSLSSDDNEESEIPDCETDSEDKDICDHVWVSSPDWVSDETYDQQASFTAPTLAESLLGQSATEHLWTKSNHKKIAHMAQPKTVIAIECDSKNVIHEAATGSGKTITMGILMLLHPKTIFITVSPLNELQHGQVTDLEEIGIKSLAVNGSTDNSMSFWKGILEEGIYQNFIVQPEIFWEGGVHSHFKTLLRHPEFRKRAGFLLMDEAHNIDHWGCLRNGSPAFQPTWACLGEACTAFLGPHQVLAFTATAPGEIMHQIINSLHLHPDNHWPLQIIYRKDECRKRNWNGYKSGACIMLIATSSAGTAIEEKSKQALWNHSVKACRQPKKNRIQQCILDYGKCGVVGNILSHLTGPAKSANGFAVMGHNVVYHLGLLLMSYGQCLQQLLAPKKSLELKAAQRYSKWCCILLSKTGIETLLKSIKPTPNIAFEILSELGCRTGDWFQPYALEIFDIIHLFDTVDWPKYAHGVQDKANAEAFRDRHKLRQTVAMAMGKSPAPQPSHIQTKSKQETLRPQAPKVLNEDTNTNNHSSVVAPPASLPPHSPSHRHQTHSSHKAFEPPPNQPISKHVRKDTVTSRVDASRGGNGLDQGQTQRGRQGRAK